MPRQATGAVHQKGGHWYARLALGPLPKDRRSIALPTCSDEPAALARLAILAPLAKRLRAAGVPRKTAEHLLVSAGAGEGARLVAVLAAIDAVCTPNATRPKAGAKEPARPSATFEEIGKRWTSGELADDHPDHVKGKKTAERDRQRLERYVYPLVTGLPVADFRLEHAEEIMQKLPKDRVRTPATRRHVAQLLHRILGLAVYPLKLIAANPLPKGFLPKVGPGKAKGMLWPDEDAALLASPAVPLCWRVLYGFLDREGPRASEAAGLTWADVDLERGAVVLDENKTDDPRAWAMSPGVVAALRAWRAMREKGRDKLSEASPVFADETGAALVVEFLADRLRDHLRAAGVDRAALFEHTASRQQIRAHDLRATMITTALANGRSEAWVQDRTGHRSSQMINKYRRAARTVAELELGDLLPLDEAIPELRTVAVPPAGESPTGPNESPTAGPGGAEAQRGEAAKQALSTSGNEGRAVVRDFESPNHGSNPCAGASDSETTAPRLGIPVGDSAPGDRSPRAALVAALAEGLRAAVDAGDLEAARVAHRAIADLLGAAIDHLPVVDLGAERRKRGGR